MTQAEEKVYRKLSRGYAVLTRGNQIDKSWSACDDDAYILLFYTDAVYLTFLVHPPITKQSPGSF